MIVDLLPSEEQVMASDSIADLLTALPVERLRETPAFAGRAEQTLWGAFAELGLFGLSVPEAMGGVGLGLADEVLAARLLGRHLASGDVVATMLAARCAAEQGDIALVKALQSGGARACLATLDSDDRARAIDGEGANLAFAWTSKDAFLWPLAAGAAAPCLDETILLRYAAAPEGSAKLREFAARARVLIAAYLTGVAEAVRDMSVAYAQTREQFGQPIGAFQAIKHACADMAVRAETAFAQTAYAALAVEATPAHDEAAAALLLASQAATQNARACVQVHGGMGFTYECDAHLYLKRAHVFSALNANEAEARATLIAR